MANTIDTIKLPPTESFTAVHTSQKRTPLWNWLALGGVLLLSLFMNFFQLGQGTYGNLYYAAGARSMTDSIHNFFFVSLDPGGFVSVDKPPLGFWLQAISAKLLGFTPFSIFLPQALCGVLAVLLLYYLVQRHFGAVAGLVAALVLAISPISVVTNRNNTIDSTLALIMLLAAWAVIRAAELGKLRWLLLSAVFVGLGFNTKMAEAYLIVPALVMTYLLCAPRKVWTRLWHLALFVVVFFALSLSWVVAVDSVPASQRPYVGSTQNNSEVGLAFGYNGISRFRINGDTFSSNGASNTNPTRGTRTNHNVQNTAPANVSESGTPGLLRLIGPSLGGQIGWLLPFACIAIVALLLQRRLRFRSDRQLIESRETARISPAYPSSLHVGETLAVSLPLVLWGFWLLTMAAFFSLDGSFHQYYMVVMAPGLSALVGIGVAIMWQDYRSGSWRGWLLPIALVVTVATQVYILKSYPIWLQRLGRPIEVLTALVVFALIVFRVIPRLRLRTSVTRIASVTVSVGLFTLLIAPTIWASYSVFHNTESSAPSAGPRYHDTTGNFFGSNEPIVQNGLPQSYTQLISYLEANQGNTKFLVATINSGTSSPIILETNKPVMTLGGFGGGDPILTTSKLQTLISNGTIRYFLLPSSHSIQKAIDELPRRYRNRLRGNFGQQGALIVWVNTHCSTIPAYDWTSTGRAGNTQLYDCAALT